MSVGSLSVERIEVRRMPGFKVRGFTVPKLSPGITVIHGPNASGKSTIANALQAALWPAKAPDFCMVQLGLRLDDEPWNVECEAGASRYTKNGTPRDPPPLPGTEAADRYLLALPDLLQVNQGEDAFAKAVLEESAGGYNVMEAASKLGFQQKPRMRHNDAKRVRDAAAEKREAIQKHEVVLQGERKLTGLQRELDETKKAQKRLEALELATQYADAREKHQATLEELVLFPQALQELRGDELEQLAQAEKKKEGHKREQEGLQQQIDKAKETLTTLGLPEKGVPETELALLQKRLQAAKDDRRERRDLERSAAGSKKQVGLARVSLGEHVQEKTLDSLDPEKWDQIAEFAHAWERNQQELRRVNAHIEHMPTGPVPDPEPIQEAITNLRSWLRTSQPTHAPPAARAPLWAATATGVLAAAIAGVVLHPAVFLLAVVSIAILAWGIMKTTTPKETDGRKTWQQAFLTTGQTPPTEWGPDAVTRTLKELEQKYLSEKERAGLVDRRKVLEQEQAELEREQAGLEQKCKQIEATLGPAPGDDPRTLLWVVERALKWREAKDELEKTHESIRVLEKRENDALTKIQHALEPYPIAFPNDLDEAEAGIEELQRRAGLHKAITTELKHANTGMKQQKKDLAECESTIRSLYERASVAVGDRRTMEKLLGQYEEYIALRKKAQGQDAVQQDRLKELRDHPYYDKQLEGSTTDTLAEEQNRQRVQTERIEELTKEINNIVRDIQDAKQSTRQAEAAAKHQEALNGLREAFIKDSSEQIGHMLARKVHEKSRDQDRPRVFHKARELLIAFTHGKYRLEFDDRDPPTFTAVDTVTETPQDLGELSSATRLQLLLAVRLAFVEQQETGLTLPMILDETLANSDDERIGAIMDTVVALARTGRQVIYLTAQADEVKKWKARFEKNGDIPHAIVDLGELRGLAKYKMAEEPVAVPVGPKPVPGPDGQTHADYADVLDVPPFDPRGTKSEIHLWYLIEDPQLLHRLLENRISSWGQLQAHRDARIPHPGEDDEPTLHKAAVLAKALETYAKAWRIGRGRPVDRSVLDASGAVSDTHIEKLAEIARERDGQAEEVIRAIDRKEVSRFYNNKRDELKQYLEEHGYLDTNPTLSGEEIRFRVQKAVAGDLTDGTITTEELDEVLRRVHERSRAVATIQE